MFDNVTVTIVAFTWGHEFKQTTWARLLHIAASLCLKMTMQPHTHTHKHPSNHIAMC